MADPDFWRRIHYEFDVLTEKEDRLTDGSRSDLRLTAYCSYGPGHPPFGTIGVNHGAIPDIRLKFDDIAVRAARALNCPQEATLIQFWLHSLYQYLLNLATSTVLTCSCGPKSTSFRA